MPGETLRQEPTPFGGGPEGTNLIRLPLRAPPPETAMPPFTWEQLEAQLAELRPERAGLANRLVGLLRRRASRHEPEQLLREMLCTAWTLLEEPAR